MHRTFPLLPTQVQYANEGGGCLSRLLEGPCSDCLESDCPDRSILAGNSRRSSVLFGARVLWFKSS